MFSRKKKNKSSNLPAISSAPSIIVSDLNISGDLVSQGSIEIGGKVKGNVKCNNVVIRKESKVDGDIYADKLIIKGTVKGVINADDVIIDETGVFEGQINYVNLTTKPGSSINAILKNHKKVSDAVVTEQSSEEFDKANDVSEKNEESTSDSNNNDNELEYIPSISTLIDTDKTPKLESENQDKTESDNTSSSEVVDNDNQKDSDLTEVKTFDSLKELKPQRNLLLLMVNHLILYLRLIIRRIE